MPNQACMRASFYTRGQDDFSSVEFKAETPVSLSPGLLQPALHDDTLISLSLLEAFSGGVPSPSVHARGHGGVSRGRGCSMYYTKTFFAVPRVVDNYIHCVCSHMYCSSLACNNNAEYVRHATSYGIGYPCLGPAAAERTGGRSMHCNGGYRYGGMRSAFIGDSRAEAISRKCPGREDRVRRSLLCVCVCVRCMQDPLRRLTYERRFRHRLCDTAAGRCAKAATRHKPQIVFMAMVEVQTKEGERKLFFTPLAKKTSFSGSLSRCKNFPLSTFQP